MLIKIIKKICFSIIIIYSLNLITANLNVLVPLNYFTIILVTILGFPGLVTLALSFFFLL